MMAHELLRQAALILAAGHSKGANARDDAGRIVELHIGANRAGINPAAVAFSPYGAICKAASQDHAPQLSGAATVPPVNLADHDGGPDHVGGALFAFRASGH